MTHAEFYTLVDKNDTEIGRASFEQLIVGTIHRTSSLLLENELGEILVVQRGLNMASYPGKWSFSAAGRLEPGETYESNIVKETEEELGVSGIEPTFISKVFVDSQRPHFSATFHANRDISLSELRLHPEEVASARWISKENLRAWLQKEPQVFTPSYRKFCESFLSKK